MLCRLLTRRFGLGLEDPVPLDLALLAVLPSKPLLTRNG